MKKHIPKNKFDIQAIDFLNTCLFENIKSDVPELLVWMQDLHWEVAHGIGNYFSPFVNDIVPELMFILNSNDEYWKKGILFALIGKSNKNLDKELEFAIKKIAETPTQGEKEEDVDTFAKEILFNRT